ncbi:hypothetical protein ACHQM5_029913 [Ranunculus cassubicifolius]
MSKSSISVAFQVSETVPARVISMERRPSSIKRLETIKEEGDVHGRNGKSTRVEGVATDFGRRRPSVVAG